VHLAQRRRGERLGVELGEDPRQPDAELGGDDPLDLVGVERRDVVLQPRQRLDVRRGEEVGPSGHQLAELDVGGAEPFEVRRQVRGRRRHAGRVGGHLVGLQAHPGDEIGAAVPHEQEADVLVPLQMARTKRYRHARVLRV
jgi:hypothetical protein